MPGCVVVDWKRNDLQGLAHRAAPSLEIPSLVIPFLMVAVLSPTLALVRIVMIHLLVHRIRTVERG